VVNLSDTKEKALNLALNKISGEWDFPKLKDILEGLDTGEFDLEITGFDLGEIEDLMTQFHIPGEGLTEDDAIPEEVETVCKAGDLWLLGEHRLLCGDATKEGDVERLMCGEKADMVWTDPPYGIDYQSSTMATDKMLGDKEDITKGLGFIRALGDIPIYIFCDFRSYPSLYNFCKIEGHPIADVIIWDKTDGKERVCEPPMALMRWIRSNEFIAYSGKLNENKGYSEDVLHCPRIYAKNVKDAQDEFIRGGIEKMVHPTIKPLAIIERCLCAHKEKIVLDPFGGSGSTLIACEKLGRRCFMMEIDEHYCDVIIQRWQNYTGKEAVKVR